MTDEVIKTVRVSEKTHEKLVSIGNKNEAFDILIDRLCDFWITYKDVVKEGL